MSVERERLLAELRPGAFAVAYRMLGSVSEAEDVVQEALLRFDQALERGEEIYSPRAYIATIATRLAIDELRSARARREVYVGEWLPEPLPTEPAPGDPAAEAEAADSLSFAFLLLLERLSPEERAAFLLHDVFDYGFAEVATVIEKSDDNARQLASRARRRVEAGRPRFAAARERREELSGLFFAAAERGDLAGLEALLRDDVVLRGDGGGKVPALARALRGAARVAGALRNWMRFGRRAGASFRPAELNGCPGALVLDPEGDVVGVLTLEVGEEEILAVNSVVNPEKLAHLGRVGDMLALLEAGRAR